MYSLPDAMAIHDFYKHNNASWSTRFHVHKKHKLSTMNLLVYISITILLTALNTP